MQEEQGQTPAERIDTIQSITGTSNDMGTHIGGASVGDAEKEGQKAKAYSPSKIEHFMKPKKKSDNLFVNVFS